MSLVNDIPAAPAAEAARHYRAKFSFETDCWDVYEAMRLGANDFVVLDVRGPDPYRAGHVPGAVSLPYRKIIESKMQAWPADTLFVVYCDGPHCNGADKAALRLAELGRPVKKMIGGVTGWLDDGFKLARGEEPASLREVEMA